jgi:hypothetical protein
MNKSAMIFVRAHDQRQRFSMVHCEIGPESIIPSRNAGDCRSAEFFHALQQGAYIPALCHNEAARIATMRVI